MDNKLVSASVVSPVVVTDEEWVGPMWDAEGNALPPTTSRTQTVFVTARWDAGDAPLSGGPSHERITQPGYVYSTHSNGKYREVIPVGTITGADGESLFDGAFTYGGMYDGHGFTMEKVSAVAP
jgi:hypothetical protein